MLWAPVSALSFVRSVFPPAIRPLFRSLLLLMICVIIIFTITSCGSESSAPQDALRESKTTAQAPETPVAHVSDSDFETVAAPVAQLKSMSWQDAFASIQSTVRYEPYVGVQRGADGTSRFRSGNSIDQTVLLATAIHDNVYAYRFVNGKLNEDDVHILVADARGPAAVVSISDSNALKTYSASADIGLVDLVSDHWWLEIKENINSDWLGLDPSFKTGKPGDVFGNAGRTVDSPRRSDFQQIKIELKMKIGEEIKPLGSMRGAVSELAFSSIQVMMRGTPIFETVESDEVEPGKPVSSSPFGGMLGGVAPAPKKTEASADKPQKAGPVVGTNVQLDLILSGKSNATPGHDILIADPQSFVQKVWIEFTLVVPGEKPRILERSLFEATSDNVIRGPVGFHQYDVSIINGQISRNILETYVAEVTSGSDVEEWQALQDVLSAENVVGADLEKAEATMTSAGRSLAGLVSMAFAHESDSIGVALSKRAGVTLTYPIPRILLTSVETRPVGGMVVSEINLDLRLDEVGAIPYDGMPEGSASLFQRARGLQESSLEGEVLKQILGSDLEPVTTVEVMRRSQDAGIPLMVLTPVDAAMVQSVKGISRWDADRLRSTLADGDNIIIPSETIVIDGNSTIGWWRIDRKTGAFIGVMQGGEHQSMVQYPVTSLNQVLSPQQAFLLGMLNGAVGTHVLLAAGMLKYGQYSQKLKEEVRNQLQYMNCVMCPEAKIEVSLGSTGGASAQISSCYEFELLENRDLSYTKSASLPFCDWYKKGVSCASSLILDGLNVSIETEAAGGLSTGLTVPYDCE